MVRIERALGPEEAAKVERLLHLYADRVEDLSQKRGDADLELHTRIRGGHYAGGRFDPDFEVPA